MPESAARPAPARTTRARARAPAPAARRAPGHASALAPPARAMQPRCACGGKAGAGGSCEECARRRRPELQRRARPGAPSDGAGGASALPTSPGRPLDGMTRRFFERRFGHGFGDVRVHDDARAAAAAREADALAFTCGRDIVFAAGRYEPAAPHGLRLLAHELTHVVQQRTGLAAARDSRHDDPAEHEAERNAERLHTREPMRFDMRAPALARQPAPDAPADPSAGVDCSEPQQRALERARQQALRWLARALSRLNDYIAAPLERAHRAVREALQRHFGRHDAPVAARVQTVLDRSHEDLDARAADSADFECHGEGDASCLNNGAFARGSLIVLCPPFFEADHSLNDRAAALIHETAHALPDGPDAPPIPDRAYDSDRLLPLLSTEEALNNAESYSMFVRETATGTTVTGSPPRDDIEDCSTPTRSHIEMSLARAQRWNNRAMTVTNGTSRSDIVAAHLGDDLPATRAAAARVYNLLVPRLRSPIDVRCDDEAASACSATRRAYKGTESNVGNATAQGTGIGAAIGFAGGLGAGLGAIAGGASVLLGLGLLGLGVLAGAAIGALVGLIVGALTPRTVVRVCPDWASLPTMEDRTESLLAAIYETHADVAPALARRYAALARALHDDYPGRAPAL